MYSLFEYGQMIADRRVDLYAEALRRSVRPGDVVVDLGAGPGLWALYACRLGARRVYAIEPDPVIGLAERLAEVNGCAERVTCLAATAADVVLPELADVIVSDVRGVASSLFEGGVATLMDARRLLKPGGVLIPRCDELWVAVVEAPEEHEAIVGPWERRPFDLDLGPARASAVHSWRKAGAPFAADRIRSTAGRWGTIDFATVTSASLVGEVELDVHAPAAAHGLVIWFESDLVPGVRLSNAPGQPPLIYAQGFMPFPEAVRLESGDRCAVRIGAHVVNSRYIWRWQTRLERAGRTVCAFDQSTWLGEPIVAAKLRRFSGRQTVAIGDEGRRARQVLGDLIDGRTIDETAARLAAGNPAAFPHPAAALPLVERLAAGYAVAAGAGAPATASGHGRREGSG
jgi:protein arginine N-methyltransferase 1